MAARKVCGGRGWGHRSKRFIRLRDGRGGGAGWNEKGGPGGGVQVMHL